MEQPEVLDSAPTSGTLSERIQELLGSGITASVVATTVGCDPSYISQLMENEEFSNGVAVLRAGKAEAGVRRDNKWDEIEDLALERTLQNLQFVHKPTDLVRVAMMANNAKRRAATFTGDSAAAAPTVVLNFPVAAVGSIINLQINSESQVVEVDGRSMAPLPTKHLQQMVAERRKEREAAGIVDVEIPQVGAQQPTKQLSGQERKKVVSLLEQIGGADVAVPVPKVVE